MVQVAEFKEYFKVEDNNAVVTITSAGVLQSKTGSEYLQANFELDGKEGDTGYNNYITEKALPYTAQRVQSILTHNAKTDADKEKVKKAIAAVKDEDFGDWAAKALEGKTAFLAVSYSENINPKSGLPYLQFNVQGYEAPELKEIAPQDAPVRDVMGGGTNEPLDPTALPF